MLMTLNTNATYFSTVSYYSTCLGTNPLQQPLNISYNAIVSLENIVETVYLPSSGCQSSSSSLTASLYEMDDILATFTDINQELGCAAINSQINDALQNGMCEDVIKGYSFIWFSQYSAAAGIFDILLLYSSLI